MFKFKNGKKFYNLLCETNFQAFRHAFFIFVASSLLIMRWPPTEPLTVTHARDHWWTLDFANAFVSPGVNSRAELVPSPQAYARNGAPRRWLGEYFFIFWKSTMWLVSDTILRKMWNQFGQWKIAIGITYLAMIHHQAQVHEPLCLPTEQIQKSNIDCVKQVTEKFQCDSGHQFS
jgi:hypothetical protein